MELVPSGTAYLGSQRNSLVDTRVPSFHEAGYTRNSLDGHPSDRTYKKPLQYRYSFRSIKHNGLYPGRADAAIPFNSFHPVQFGQRSDLTRYTSGRLSPSSVHTQGHSFAAQIADFLRCYMEYLPEYVKML